MPRRAIGQRSVPVRGRRLRAGTLVIKLAAGMVLTGAVLPALTMAAGAEAGAETRTGTKAEAKALTETEVTGNRGAATAVPGTSAPGRVERPSRRQTALPRAEDLSARAGVRHLVLFSVTNCPWCEIVRVKHLRHRVDARRGDIRIAVSEVMIDRDDPLIGPDGQPPPARDLARRLGARVGPTVLAFDEAGPPVGEPLVGALLEDFYEAYVDRLVEQAVGPAR